MKYAPQHFVAPDGTDMVVMRARDYEALLAAVEVDEDARDIAAADAARAASDVLYPSQVVDDVLAGSSILAAWRRYRGMSQAELARRAELSQSAISMLEKRPNAYGRRASRIALARALDIPLAALDPLED